MLLEFVPTCEIRLFHDNSLLGLECIENSSTSLPAVNEISSGKCTLILVLHLYDSSKGNIVSTICSSIP